MTFEDKINRLLRERQLSMRRLNAAKLMSVKEARALSEKPGREGRDLTQEERTRLYEARLQEDLTPAPRTLMDYLLWFRGRSLNDIDRDLSAIPQPKVEVSEQPQGAAHSGSGHIAVFWCSPLAPLPPDTPPDAPPDAGPGLPATKGAPGYWLWSNSRAEFPPGLIEGWIKGHPIADPSVECFMTLRGGPCRSRLGIMERQNHDGHMVGYGGQKPLFERHFELEIGLSGALWGELRAILAGTAPEPSAQEETRHILGVPVPHLLAGRPMDVGSAEPFVETPGLPLRDIAVFSVRGRPSEWRPYQVRHLREIG